MEGKKGEGGEGGGEISREVMRKINGRELITVEPYDKKRGKKGK